MIYLIILIWICIAYFLTGLFCELLDFPWSSNFRLKSFILWPIMDYQFGGIGK